VKRIERTEFLMATWVAAILLALYLLLLFVVHRSERIIDRQRDTILERTRTLELLSARMLSAEERERAKISAQLHEGIAQDLSAIKLRIEQLCQAGTANQEAGGESGLCERVVPEVQKAIQDVRAMAMDIHPPSLDDFGLLPTVSWLKNEFTAIYPAMQIESGATIEEGRIPVPMKAIMFRIIQETLGWIAKRLVTKYGNKDTYAKTRNFFIGLIVGELLIVVLAMITAVATGRGIGIDLNRQ